MNKNFSRVVFVSSLICLITSYPILASLWHFDKIWMFDFQGQWALNAYALHFVDPYPLVGNSTPLIEEIGCIPKYFGTTPWGLLLGNFFYPGFLPAEDAAIYFVALNVIFFFCTALFMARNFPLDKGTILSVTLVAFFANFFVSEHWGNSSAVTCCLLLISCLRADSQPIFSGILLSLAMVRPQVALPICFALLLRKNFKVLTVAAMIDLTAWEIVALMTEQSPLNLLQEFLSLDTGGRGAFSGLFTLVFPTNKSLAMLTSMIAGVVFIWLTFKEEKFFWAVPACLATTFFAYSSYSQFFILILPALVCLKFAVRAEIFREKFFWLATVIFMAMAPYSSIVLMKIFFGNTVLAFLVARTIFAVVIIVLGFLMARHFKWLLQ